MDFQRTLGEHAVSSKQGTPALRVAFSCYPVWWLLTRARVWDVLGLR